MNFVFTQEIITPSDAQEILARCNNGNRNPVKAKIEQYQKAMRADRWKLTPVPLIFEEHTGRLLDGQNRLSAVVKSGKTQTFVVCRNAQSHLMTAIDQGKSRTASDHMKISNINNANQLAPLVLAIYSYQQDPKGNWALLKPVANEIYVETFEADSENISHALGFGKLCEKSFNLISKTDYGFAYYLLRKAGFDEMVLIEFFNSLSTGANLLANSPVLAYRRFLSNDPKRYAGDRGRRQHSINNILKAFKMYYNSEECASHFRAAPLLPTVVPCA